MKHARIDANVVIEVWDEQANRAALDEVFAPELAAQFIPVPSQVDVGWSLVGADWEPPLQPTPEQPDSGNGTIVTAFAFRQRFLQSERIAIEMAGLDAPSATMEERQRAAAIRTYAKDVDTAEFIDLSDAATVNGVQQLEALEIIAAGRAKDILEAPVQLRELPGRRALLAMS